MNITQHLLHHVVTGIRKFGPLYSTWMYGFERLNGWCSDRAINRRHPESTIIETYLLYDFSPTLAALGIISRKYLEGGDEFEKDGGHLKTVDLSRATLNDIFESYCTRNIKLLVLWSIYKNELKQQQTKVDFNSWSPKNRLLTQEEQDLLTPLSKFVFYCDKTSVKNEKKQDA